LAWLIWVSRISNRIHWPNKNPDYFWSDPVPPETVLECLLAEKRGPPRLIGVAGGSASGKSTVCEKIMENLRPAAFSYLHRNLLLHPSYLNKNIVVPNKRRCLYGYWFFNEKAILLKVFESMVGWVFYISIHLLSV
jgi:hypothetical protein